MEIYQSQDKGVKFYFTHSDSQFTTGVMEIQPHYELPKHNRPLAIENLVQVSGVCVMKLFSDDNHFHETILNIGDFIQIPKGIFHIHANPYDNISLTLFKADGDITQIMENLRKDFIKLL